MLDFISTKNGQTSVSINGIYLHSTYNPDSEAKRFTDNITSTFKPEYILITEPAISYCAPFIKQKFPESELICIRYTPEFSRYNSNFDVVFNYFEHTSNFEDYFFNYFGEEKLYKILFLKWEASSKAFPKEDTLVWKAIKSSLLKAKTLLITREYFEKKWVVNSVNFFKYISKVVLPYHVEKPVLIVASGPSLKPLLSVLPEVKDKLFIICLSSAISVLNKFNITPDIYLSTDGGYWAGQHLKKINTNNKIPIALPAEAFCNKKLINNSSVIPLNYGDGFSSQLFNFTKLPCINAERNGTVSGTALKLAMKLTDKEIFFTGLDLSVSKKRSHTDPNEIELNNSISDNKIRSKEKRITAGGINSESLDIYKNWFSSQNFANRNVFRIIENEYKNNSLGEVKDISINEFMSQLEGCNSDSTAHYEEFLINNNYDLLNFCSDYLNCSNNLKQIFPLDYTSLAHAEDKDSITGKIETKKNELYNKIKRILND